jgi:hypothetical protein
LRVWVAQTGACIGVIRGSGDVAAIAEGTSSGLLWSAICRDRKLVIEPTGGGESLTRFPAAIENTTAHSNGRTWAGASRNHVYILTLEGDPSPPPPKPHEQQ